MNPQTAAALSSLPSLPDWASRLCHRILTGRLTATDRLWERPEEVLTRAGIQADPWQKALLRSTSRRHIILASRQTGKSTTSAGLALKKALLEDGSRVLLLSPTQRQSGELFRKVMDLYNALGRPVRSVRSSALQIELVNGSRIISLPGVEATVRSFSAVALIIIDEAARVSDDLYKAVRPMLAVSGGTLVAVSSAYAKLGWFYDGWQTGMEWERTKVTAEECPRISREFLAEERRVLGSRWYAMEYEGVFADAIDAVFRAEDVEAALDNELEPLFG